MSLRVLRNEKLGQYMKWICWERKLNQNVNCVCCENSDFRENDIISMMIALLMLQYHSLGFMQDVRAKLILFIYFHQLRHCVKASIARSTLFALRHH